MRWISWVTCVVGVWLIAAPFALGYSGTFQAATNDIGLGALIAASSLWLLAFEGDTPGWLHWALMLFGVWTIAAPFALGYSSTTNAMMNDVAAGAIVVALAIREVFTGGRARVLHA